MGHARCHRAKATSRYLVMGRRGVEFVDLKTGVMVANFWVRGMCQYGMMPANGLLYLPPHSCACSVNDMLKSGFLALAPENELDQIPQPVAAKQLDRGKAYGYVPAADAVAAKDDWPTYRHDAARSGAAPPGASISHDLETAWETDMGGKITGPVVGGGLLLAADTDKHYLHALDANTGQSRWTHIAGARIDSPPTIDAGRVLFGSADGRVYCLRLEDGELIWKFRAAPRERRIVVEGQLESTWPVSGNVLVMDGAAYVIAGRTSYMDEGMFFYKLDAATGQVIRFIKLEVEPKRRDGGSATGGYLPDILSSDGESIFLRGVRFDRDLVQQKSDVAHLWSSVGFLDDSWWHRVYWQIGTSMSSGWGGWPKAGQRVPSGRLLVTDGARVFGFGRNQYDIPGAHLGIDAEGVWGPIGKGQSRWTFYQLFGQPLAAGSDKASRRQAAPPAPASGASTWKHRIPILAQAMVLAGETLFLAGPRDTVEEIPHDPAETDALAEALDSNSGGRLLAVSVSDGKILADSALKNPPVFDGMVVAGGRLYLSTKNGRVVCMSPAK